MKIYDILIWGINDEYNQYFNQILFEIYKNNINVLALVSKDRYANRLDGFDIISKDKINDYFFDYIVIFNKLKFDIIKQEALNIGIKESVIIDGQVFGIPYFDFKKYVSLIRNPITIISNNCWGGRIYHLLHLKMTSPFINCWLSSQDYLKLLSKLEYYMSTELKMEEEGNIYESRIPKGYLGEKDKIVINFNHHMNFISAKNDWDRRKERMNYNNLFIKWDLSKNSPVLEKQFDILPYKNKICFTIADTDYESSKAIPRYLWKCKNIPVDGLNFPIYIQNMECLKKSVDILSLLTGETNFIREMW